MNEEPNLTKPVYFSAKRSLITLILQLNLPELKSPVRTQSTNLKFQAINLLQNLLKFHLNDANPQALSDAGFKRIKFVNANICVEQKDNNLYIRLKLSGTLIYLLSSGRKWYLMNAHYFFTTSRKQRKFICFIGFEENKWMKKEYLKHVRRRSKNSGIPMAQNYIELYKTSYRKKRI